MPTKLREKAVEGSTFGIRADFVVKLPEGDTPVVPNSPLTWSLRDKDGNVINSKQDQPLTPAASVDIVLSGGDLALLDNHPEERFVTINGTYNSVYGNNLLLVDEVSFQITNLVGEPNT